MPSTRLSVDSIQAAIKRERYDEAVKQASSLLEKDPTIFHAHVLSAFAFDNLNQPESAEKSYRDASILRPTDLQPWQGLIQLYERSGSKLPSAYASYRDAVVRLATLFADRGIVPRCWATVNRFINWARCRPDQAQYADALGLLLPEHPLWAALQGQAPPPVCTYDTIAQIVDAEDKRRINHLIGERRTRLGARLIDVTADAKREVLARSNFEHLCAQVITWASDSDEDTVLRRDYEERLLRRVFDRLLCARPGPEKIAALDMVVRLAADAVVIRHPFQFAWDIHLNWIDLRDVADWDPALLLLYCSFFPASPLAAVLKSFFASPASPFPPMEPEATGPNDPSLDSDSVPLQASSMGVTGATALPLASHGTESDRLVIMMDGAASSNSILAYRLIGLYLKSVEDDDEIAVELMRSALKVVDTEQTYSGGRFQNAEAAFSVQLATILVHYQSPRHHAEAKSLFDRVLEQDPASAAALIGVGLILEEEEEYDHAMELFERALAHDDTDPRVIVETAGVRILRGEFLVAKAELEVCLSCIEAMSLLKPRRELLARAHHGIGLCVWGLEPTCAARKRRDAGSAYSWYLAAVGFNPDFPPAYTSLGLYYADYARDRKRALRCFQRAVELSPSELVAAERLARLFANEADWERVELVARRVVTESGRVRPLPGSRRKAVAWPLAALGVAELSRQDYHAAAVSLQAALRIDSSNYRSWIGLGEAYFGCGRYVAASRALLTALQKSEGAETDGSRDIDKEPDQQQPRDELWLAKFILANVKREMGEFEEAATLYRAVLETRPDEVGVAVALIQALTENAQHGAGTGYFGKAVGLATDVINFARMAGGRLASSSDFWTALSGACAVFSLVQSRLPEFPADLVEEILNNGTTTGASDSAEEKALHSSLSRRAADDSSRGNNTSSDLALCLELTLGGLKRASEAISTGDRHSLAEGYYNMGWAEYLSHSSLPKQSRAGYSDHLHAAIRCFKHAIETEAGNAQFWEALGVAASTVNPAVAQHAFVRSLHLSERCASTWTNLGTLALLRGDSELAHEAFTRARAADPDYALAWVGQAFVAGAAGDTVECGNLLAHAADMVDASSSLAALRHYPVSAFDQIKRLASSGAAAPDSSALCDPLFALVRLHSLRPQDLAYGHLTALLHERAGDVARSVGILESVTASAEADFEMTESNESLARFALASADLARVLLASGALQRAAECAETALSLTEDEADNELAGAQRQTARLSALVTIRLAHSRTGNHQPEPSGADGAAGLGEMNDPDVVCLMAQIHWATGTEESRNLARETLAKIRRTKPEHVESLFLTAAVALADGTMHAAKLATLDPPLRLVSLRPGTSAQDRARANRLLGAVALRVGGPAALLAHAKAAVVTSPFAPGPWEDLAQLVGHEEPAIAEMALRVTERCVAPRGRLGASDLARAMAGTGTARDAHRAVVVAPWLQDGWHSLVEAVA